MTPGGLQQRRGDRPRPVATETSHSSLDDAPAPTDQVGGFPGFVSLEAANAAGSRVVDPVNWVKIDNPGETEIGTHLFEKFTKGLEHHTMEFARVTTRMAYSLFQEAHVAERDALESRGDAQLMEAVKGASKAESDARTMKLWYSEEIAKLRRVNDCNTVKFMSATGVTMDKWDGGVDALRKLLLKHEQDTATQRMAAPVYSRRPAVSKPKPTEKPKAPPVVVDLTVKPAAGPRGSPAQIKKEAEDAKMDSEDATTVT